MSKPSRGNNLIGNKLARNAMEGEEQKPKPKNFLPSPALFHLRPGKGSDILFLCISGLGSDDPNQVGETIQLENKNGEKWR
jgi:P pilus assembly chaperone PapD